MHEGRERLRRWGQSPRGRLFFATRAVQRDVHNVTPLTVALTGSGRSTWTRTACWTPRSSTAFSRRGRPGTREARVRGGQWQCHANSMHARPGKAPKAACEVLEIHMFAARGQLMSTRESWRHLGFTLPTAFSRATHACPQRPNSSTWQVARGNGIVPRPWHA